MGIIQKQAISGSIYSYIGVLLGFLITGVIAPRLLSTEENGVIKLLVSYSGILAIIGSLGFVSVINRLFPYFRSRDSKHNGFFLLMTIVTLFGFLLTLIIFYTFRSSFFYQSAGEENKVLETYLGFIPVLTFFILLFLMFDNYARVLYNAVIGTISKELIQRILILAVFIFYFLKYFNFDYFVAFYVLCFAFPPFLLFSYLLVKREVSFVPKFGFISKSFMTEIVDVAMFGLIAGFANIAILSVDSIMVSQMISVSATGIYSITFFFGTLVIIPSRAMKKIASPIIAESWKNNDVETVKDVYYKSTIIQFIIGLLLFIGIWANIDNILILLPPEYAPGKYVILFIALANLMEMTAGITTTILNTSVYYRYMSWFMAVLILLLIVTNYIFIPIMGIVGAAVASALSYLIFILLRFFLIKRKFKMQPYNIRFVFVLIIGIVVYGISLLVPTLEPYYLDIVVRSGVITVIYLALVIFSRISHDLNNQLKAFINFKDKFRSGR